VILFSIEEVLAVVGRSFIFKLSKASERFSLGK